MLSRVKFIKISKKNIEKFEDLDKEIVYDSCIYVDGGIVVSNDMFLRYSDFIRDNSIV